MADDFKGYDSWKTDPGPWPSTETVVEGEPQGESVLAEAPALPEGVWEATMREAHIPETAEELVALFRRLGFEVILFV